MLLCGWRVRSEVPLPELSSWVGGERAVDVMLTVGSIPDRLRHPVVETPFLQIDEDGTCRLDIPTVGVFLVRGGWDVIVAPRVDTDSIEIRNFILGPVLGLLAHQRGLVPLQAAAVCIDGIAVAFAGPSRSGKSTVAAALARRGHAVLSDDICVVDIIRGVPVVLPSSSHVRLWQDACAALNLGLEAAPESLRVGQGRYFVSVSGVPMLDHGVPLSALYILGGQRTSLNRAAAAVVAQVYGHHFAGAFGGGEGRARRAGAIAQLIPVIDLARPGFSDLDDWVRGIEKTCLERVDRKRAL
jgi:hypothetical protein